MSAPVLLTGVISRVDAVSGKHLEQGDSSKSRLVGASGFIRRRFENSDDLDTPLNVREAQDEIVKARFDRQQSPEPPESYGPPFESEGFPFA